MTAVNRNVLNVWMGSDLLGRLTRTRSGIRFAYTAEVVERFGLGVPLVSVALPTSMRPFSRGACEPFFDGLLPEGESRRIIAYDLGVAGFDTFALLAALGRDCAGALSIVGESDEPPIVPTGKMSADAVKISADDSRMVTAGGGKQFGGNPLVLVYDKSLGCRWYNTQTGAIGGAWGQTGTVAMLDRFPVRHAAISGSGKYVKISVGRADRVLYLGRSDSECGGLPEDCRGAGLHNLRCDGI